MVISLASEVALRLVDAGRKNHDVPEAVGKGYAFGSNVRISVLSNRLLHQESPYDFVRRRLLFILNSAWSKMVVLPILLLSEEVPATWVSVNSRKYTL